MSHTAITQTLVLGCVRPPRGDWCVRLLVIGQAGKGTSFRWPEKMRTSGRAAHYPRKMPDVMHVAAQAVAHGRIRRLQYESGVPGSSPVLDGASQTVFAVNLTVDRPPIRLVCGLLQRVRCIEFNAFVLYFQCMSRMRYSTFNPYLGHIIVPQCTKPLTLASIAHLVVTQWPDRGSGV